MVDDVKKSEAARQERIRQEAQEKAKTRPKTGESEFDKLVKKGTMPRSAEAAKQFNKPVTERAMEEAAKRHERDQDARRKDKDEKKEKKETRQTGERADAKVAGQKVVGKGARGQGGRGQGGRGQGSQSGSTAKRGLSRKLSKAGVKTLPMDLQKKFAAKMAKAAAQTARPDASRLTQHVLNKIVQHVRIGINRKGEKEIQVDLHEKVFRGLKLRVTEKDGKVNVYFRTLDEKGRAVLEKNSDAIRDALSEKGIDVEEISVA